MPVDNKDNLIEFTDCLSEICAIVESNENACVYILGDFNASPNSLFGNELSKFCSEQCWVCADIEKLGLSSDTFTFLSDAHGTTSWIDHCLVTESAWASVSDVKVHYDSHWSDHFPIEVTCNLSLVKVNIVCDSTLQNGVIWGERDQNQIDMYTKLCNKSLMLINLSDIPVDCCDTLCSNLNHRIIIDRLYNDIVSVLREAAMSSANRVPSRKRRPVVVGWNKHVKDVHEASRCAFHTWLLHGKPTKGKVYDDMSEARRVFKAKLKWCQKNAEQIKMDILASHHSSKSFKEFWKATKKLNPRTNIPLCVDGKMEPSDIANMFSEHFRVEPAQLATACSSFLPPVRTENVSSTAPTSFSEEEVAEVVRNMARGKSPGHDGLSVEHLRYAGKHLSRVLAIFYSLCVRHSYLPSECMKTVVVPIIKNKTGDSSDKSNYRPISLATSVAKVLDCLLDRILRRHVNLNDAQFGFRPGLSTETAILCLKQTVRYYTDRKTPVYACFLDLSKAFDLVSYEVLWRKMRTETSLPCEVINLFGYWYNNQINTVRWAGALSDEYGLKCGVRQGGLTSPRIFNLYINGLIEELTSAGVGCSIDGSFINNLSYADDMVLLGPSISAVRKLLKICEDYAGAYGLRYNVKKSELLVFQPREQKISMIPPVFLNGVELPRVKRFKYLGHWVTDDLKDVEDIERERRALAVRSNMLARRFAQCTGAVKVTLFKAFCQSFYTCSLWVSYSKKAVNALRVQYNNGFRALVRLPKCCSASGMFADAHIDGFQAILRKRAGSLLRRVHSSKNRLLKVLAGKVDCPIMWRLSQLHVISNKDI